MSSLVLLLQQGCGCSGSCLLSCFIKCPRSCSGSCRLSWGSRRLPLPFSWLRCAIAVLYAAITIKGTSTAWKHAYACRQLRIQACICGLSPTTTCIHQQLASHA